MTKKTLSIKLSLEELEVLSFYSLSNETLASLLKLNKTQGHGNLKFQIDSLKCEELRTVLTELLAKVGFDTNYALTKEGRVLEDLIDKLYEGE